ncbi:hypothetical protein SHIRM173S_02824 [Streptomyces hirsutus]
MLSARPAHALTPAGKLGGRQRGLAGLALGITPRNKF